ncbi:MAG TPA: lipoate--protein ligase family protein, partial [Rhabdochlamydiaceae bacterium]|nr:lipoate--protein ligase family protein [Rhabdochlamydiaceae bacterium]
MTLHLLHLQEYPIFDQLQLEEALVRSDERNWCIINEGSPRSIVMGISGKPEELIDQKKLNEDPVPVIKRFSGGGTVIVDSNTLFISFIFQKELHRFPAYPEPILKWSAELYQSSFMLDSFHLRENDYVIGEKKCGGNAQYIRKDRWLHHTSFLWDFHQENMHYLLHPKKTPKYRSGRSHEEFLCRLSDHFSDKEELLNRLKEALRSRYTLIETDLANVVPVLQQLHRKTTIKCGQFSPSTSDQVP